MRRDLGLIRELMLRLEALPLGALDVLSISYYEDVFKVDGYTFDQVVYHLSYMLEAGFIEPRDSQGMTNLVYSGFSAYGHDFIDSVRDPKIWSETKAILEKTGGASLDVAVVVARALMKQNLKELGLDLDV